MAVCAGVPDLHTAAPVVDQSAQDAWPLTDWQPVRTWARAVPDSASALQDAHRGRCKVVSAMPGFSLSDGPEPQNATPDRCAGKNSSETHARRGPRNNLCATQIAWQMRMRAWQSPASLLRRGLASVATSPCACLCASSPRTIGGQAPWWTPALLAPCASPAKRPANHLK